MPNNVCDNSSLIRGSFNVCLQGIDLGPTAGELTISQRNSWETVKHGQSILIVDKFLTEQEYTVTVAMRALLLDRMRVIFGVKEGLNGSTLCFRQSLDGCTFPERFSLTIVGPGPGCGCRNFHFPSVAVTQDTIDYMINQEQLTEVEVQFTAFPDCDGLVGCITDVCSMISAGGAPFELDCEAGGDPIPDYVPPTTGA